MNTWKKIGISLLLAACGSTAGAEEFRVVCESNVPNPCGMKTTATITARAIETAVATNAVVGDEILFIGYGMASGGQTEKMRSFWVVSTPVTSAANLGDSGYLFYVNDAALPSPPSLRGEGAGAQWFLWFLQNPGNVYVRQCSGRLSCW